MKNSLGACFGHISGTNRAGFGAFEARFVVVVSSMPTFSTGCSVLRSRCEPNVDRVMITQDESNVERVGMSKKSTQDRAKGAVDKAKGRVKEAGGSLSGDSEKKAEGRADQREGKAKDKKGAARDLAQ